MRKGFTLIELLVVIAIIAILAAILFPVFAKAREKARQTSCQSNEKQIGTAIMMYVQDYEELMPGFKHYLVPGNSNTRGEGWYDVMEPYTRNEQIGRCPSYSYVATYARTALPVGEGFGYNSFKGSYGVPAQDANCRASLGTLYTMWNYYPPGVALAQVTRPAETVMLFEATTSWTQQVSGYGRDASGNLVAITADGRRGVQHFRHNGQMNVLFADGHVKSVGPGFMADLEVYKTMK